MRYMTRKLVRDPISREWVRQYDWNRITNANEYKFYRGTDYLFPVYSDRVYLQSVGDSGLYPTGIWSITANDTTGQYQESGYSNGFQELCLEIKRVTRNSQTQLTVTVDMSSVQAGLGFSWVRYDSTGEPYVVYQDTTISGRDSLYIISAPTFNDCYKLQIIPFADSDNVNIMPTNCCFVPQLLETPVLERTKSQY